MPAVLVVLSCVVLTLEVLETKIFAYSLENNLMFVVVGLVLLGFGAGGTALCLRKTLGDERALVKWNLWSMAALVLVAHVWFAQFSDRLTFELDFFTVSTLLLLASPYFNAGMAVSAILAGAGGRVHLLYGYNLLGSAVGCTTVFVFLGALNAPELLVAAAGVVALLAASLHTRPRVPVVGVLLATPVLFLMAETLFPYRMDPTGQLALIENSLASLEKDGQASSAGIAEHYDRWDPTARIQVHSIEVETANPGIREVLDRLPSMWFTQDSSYGSPLIGAGSKPDAAEEFYRRTVYGMGYFRGRPDEDVLVIGLGGAPDVQVALYHGARSVVCVDINGATIEMVRGPMKDFLGDPYRDPRVELHVRDGRSFVRGDDRLYDHIQLSGVDTKSVLAAGTLAINESYLYTREAFSEYLARLKPEGILCIGYAGEAYMHRMAISAIAALEELGAKEPYRHVMLLVQSAIVAVLVKRTPFTKKECEQMDRWLADSDNGTGRTGVFIAPYEVLVPGEPGVPGALSLERLPDPVFIPDGRPTGDPIMRAAVEGRLDEVLAADPVTDLSPVPDSRPFFFHLIRTDAVFDNPPPYFARLFNMVLIMGALALLLIAGPLVVFKARGVPVLPSVPMAVYFACLGAGFILAEIGLIQRYVLFLGHQGYAFPAVIGGLLVTAGLGSMLAQRWRTSGHWMIPGAVLVICAAIWAHTELLDPLFAATASAPLFVRGALSVAVLVPLGVPLGMLFPTGLAMVRESSPLFVPWAFGINGVFSVIGTTVVLPGAILYGYPTIAAGAAGLYVLAALVALPLVWTARGRDHLPTSSSATRAAP